MAIQVTCSACQYRFAVPDAYAGKRGKCPKCSAVIVAAAAADAPPPAPAPPASAPPPRAAAPPVRKPPPAAAPPVRMAPAAPPAMEEAPAPAALAAPLAFEAPSPASRVAARRSARKSNNAWTWIFLGAGGGVLALAVLVLVVVLGMSAGKEVAENEPAPANSPASKKSPDDDSDSEGGLLDRPRGPVTIQAAAPRSAQSLEEIMEGVVKIETPGKSLGTGFLINDKGWIATNSHVIEGATDQTVVVMTNGQKYKVAGLVARDVNKDMALIKLAEQPFQMTILDISFTGHPKLASKVYAVGYPHDIVALTEGIVSRVATTDQLNDRQRAFILTKMTAAQTHQWIQHTAKISPGNSGGPLLNEQLQVVGINTWVSGDVDLGYAGHVDHLRELIAAASDNVTPFPKGVGVEIADEDQLYNVVLTADRMRQLVTYCGNFQWQPTSEEQFDAMAELAKIITLVELWGKAPPEIRQEAQVACQAIAQVDWTGQHVAAINRFAADAAEKPLHGTFFFATVVESSVKIGPTVVDQLKLEGTGKFVVVEPLGGKSLGAKDARLLVLGLNMPAALGGDNVAANQRLVRHGYALQLD